MPFTNYWNNKILDHLFGAQNYTPPANLYVGLSTTAPNADGTGVTEPSGANGYARVVKANNKTNWSVAANGTLSNATAINFANPSASWGTVTHVLLYDAVSGGNLLGYQTLAQSKSVPQNQPPYFAIGDLDITTS